MTPYWKVYEAFLAKTLEDEWGDWAREEAEAIIRQTGMQDIVEFEDNAEFATMVADDIRESTAKMQEVFGRTFGGGADSYEYERALEQKIVEEEPVVLYEDAAPVADKQE